MVPVALAAIALLVIAGLFAPAWWSARRRRLALERPFPPPWRRILFRNVPLYARLPLPLRQRLERRMQVFLAEKPFVGCAGQEIDDEVRVTIAAQACLLRLGRASAGFERLTQILVYPGAFVVERVRPEPSGILQETRQVLTGESWTQGQVVLSWQDVLEGSRISDDGRNVTIHEFAHQLDQEKGYANGAPPLAAGARSRWSSVLAREYARLQHQLAWGEPTLINAYGATAPEEFFAVVSEAFFEQPQALRERHPELYAELAAYYRLDPAAW